MKFLQGLLILVLGLALFASLGWAVLRVFLYMRAQHDLLGPESSAIIVLLSAVAAACCLYLGWTVRSALHRHGRATLAARAAAYQDFVSLWFPLSATGKPLAEWPDAWRDLQPRLALLAGDKVLKKYQQLQRKTDASPPGDSELGKAAEQLVLEMRKDLGAMNRDWDPRAWRKLLG